MRALKTLLIRAAIAGLMLATIAPNASRAAERDELLQFLDVTGFGVALDTLAQAAEGAPEMIGLSTDELGPGVDRLTREVFAPRLVREKALNMLARGLKEEQLRHAVRFYSTPLGQRFVAAENASANATEKSEKSTVGAEIVAKLAEASSSRLDDLRRMTRAIDPRGAAAHAMTQIQYRYLLAAQDAGLISLRLGEEALYAALSANEDAVLRQMRQSALISAAYVYRDFDDADLTQYADALESEQMQQVYALMNALQYEITANRFEVLAQRLARLAEAQDT